MKGGSAHLNLLWLKLWPFGCKHPADLLSVESKPETTGRDADFTEHRMKLRCTCGEVVTVKWAECIGGVDAFLRRAPAAGAARG